MPKAGVRGYPFPMKSKSKKKGRPATPHLKDGSVAPPPGGHTRPPTAPLERELEESYEQVQPPGFGGYARSSIDAAVTDADVEDTIGAE